ncbi:hypothetical protein [Ottowia sp.]|uniref:hypothetical protein n=1 Tax=Ottowia sp. TaxID=1898956 RepID=UPI002605E7CF|nr:hypothetical protein [Ottowia sp.]
MQFDSKRSVSRGFVAAVALLLTHGAQAATFLTFLDDQAGFMSAIGSGTVVRTEDFSTVVDGQLVAAESASPDVWNGFTVQVIGNGTSYYSPSKYCTALNSASCINWNSQTPAVPGIYGAFANPPEAGLSIKPLSSTIAGFSFDFSDWNDLGQRSEFLVLASDGTSTLVTGPSNPPGAPPKNFGVTLAPADIAAGRYLTEVRWVGVSGQSEVVGFYNFKTYTNPVLTPAPVPALSGWMLMLLSAGCAGLLEMSRRRGGPTF